MSPRNTRSNPLALAALTCLFEKPMHPYEIVQTLRTRAKHESIRLNYGSLYGVVKSLDKRGLIREVETVREGNRPERTVYDITDAGRTEMRAWLIELVTVPVKEYTQFEAALSLLGVFSPDEATRLLQQRCDALQGEIDELEATLAHAMETYHLPRMHVMEGEYVITLWRAELAWTKQLIADIESGQLDGVDQWRAWHTDSKTGGTP